MAHVKCLKFHQIGADKTRQFHWNWWVLGNSKGKELLCEAETDSGYGLGFVLCALFVCFTF